MKQISKFKFYDMNDATTKVTMDGRTAKNKSLYEQIKTSEIEKFELNNNATIIGEDIDAIDVNKIKDMLPYIPTGCNPLDYNLLTFVTI